MNKNQTILLTGGAGYIGSHTAVELMQRGFSVVIADNFSNSVPSVLDRIEKITGLRPALEEADLCDPSAAAGIFDRHHIDAVIHFAGFKAVGESVAKPVAYYRNNLDSTLSLLETMDKWGCHRLIFSSSATVYGESKDVPYKETQPVGGCTNPYGRTKYFIEQILQDKAKADPQFSAVLLRYFNPIGAHESGLIGERPNGVPNNLMPYITQTAAGQREMLNIFGDDYDTPDGTGVRDYIHVCDLAAGHAAALAYSESHTGAEIFNLGTGRGVSVLEMVAAFEKATGITVPYRIAQRRPGDIATSFADPSKAMQLLGWKAVRTIEDCCRDSWRWESDKGTVLLSQKSSANVEK